MQLSVRRGLGFRVQCLRTRAMGERLGFQCCAFWARFKV